MQENVSVWPPSEEDLELMSQRGFVCMRDCQSEFLRITVKHVGNFLVKTKAIIYFYRGRSSIKALNTLTIYHRSGLPLPPFTFELNDENSRP